MKVVANPFFSDVDRNGNLSLSFYEGGNRDRWSSLPLSSFSEDGMGMGPGGNGSSVPGARSYPSIYSQRKRELNASSAIGLIRQDANLKIEHDSKTAI